MKPKPTPGPWTVDKWGWCAESETWDNQYLIAAAPDLLKALESVMAALMSKSAMMTRKDWSAIDFANEAIRKAEGHDS